MRDDVDERQPQLMRIQALTEKFQAQCEEILVCNQIHSTKLLEGLRQLRQRRQQQVKPAPESEPQPRPPIDPVISPLKTSPIDIEKASEASSGKISTSSHTHDVIAMVNSPISKLGEEKAQVDVSPRINTSVSGHQVGLYSLSSRQDGGLLQTPFQVHYFQQANVGYAYHFVLSNMEGYYHHGSRPAKFHFETATRIIVSEYAPEILFKSCYLQKLHRCSSAMLEFDKRLQSEEVFCAKRERAAMFGLLGELMLVNGNVFMESIEECILAYDKRVRDKGSGLISLFDNSSKTKNLKLNFGAAMEELTKCEVYWSCKVLIPYLVIYFDASLIETGSQCSSHLAGYWCNNEFIHERTECSSVNNNKCQAMPTSAPSNTISLYGDAFLVISGGLHARNILNGVSYDKHMLVHLIDITWGDTQSSWLHLKDKLPLKLDGMLRADDIDMIPELTVMSKLNYKCFAPFLN